MKKIRLAALIAWLAGVTVAAAPDPLVIKVTNLDGKAQWLTDYKGKIILLNFWSTTCPPCRVETPWFVEFQQRWRDRGFVILGVSMDDAPAQIKDFMQKFAINYPMFEGRAAEDDIQKATGGIWGLPMTYVIGRDGNVRQKHLGLMPKAQLEREIEDALRR